jgi:hypothetical protein
METYVDIDVSLDEDFIPGNRHHCPIANAIMLFDSDIVFARVDKDRITFSRRNTGIRYTFKTPETAAEFIHEVDKLIAADDGTGKVRNLTAQPFHLRLTARDLIEQKPRFERDARQAIKRAVEKVGGGSLPIKGKKSQSPVKTTRTSGATAGPRHRPSQRVAG